MQPSACELWYHFHVSIWKCPPPPPTNREGSSLILEPPHLGHNLSSFIQIKFGSHFDYDNIYFGIICDKKYRNTYYISSHSILWRRTWAYRQANQWVMQFSPSAHPLTPHPIFIQCSQTNGVESFSINLSWIWLKYFIPEMNTNTQFY